MKTIRTIFVVAMMTILIAGCGEGISGPSLEISCEQFYEEAFLTDNVSINSGEEITIKLCSNPSTGFQWSDSPENSHPEILSLDSHDYQIEGENLPPGTPGVEIWAFTAQTPGKTTLNFEYSQDWEGGDKGVWTYTLEITVQ
jgi:inhibitor of cysteine peptidase